MNELANHSTIAEIVACYQVLCATVRRAFVDLQAAEAAMNAALCNGRDSIKRVDILHDGHRKATRLDRVDDVIDRARRNTWGAIVQRLGLRRSMPEKRALELDKQLEDGDLPEVTEENVASFAHQYMARLDEMFAEKAAECFEWLRPNSRSAAHRYKRNSELEVPRKVIIAGVMEGFCGALSVRYGCRWYDWGARLTALETLLKALDGKGHSTDNWRSDLHTAIDASCKANKYSGATEYFKFRACKNGNLHLEFLRPDLLARFNELAGGARLRPAAE